MFLMPDIDEPPRAIVTIAGQVTKLISKIFNLIFIIPFVNTERNAGSYTSTHD
jgi:hypothetical protein